MTSWDQLRAERGPVNPKDVVFPENCLDDGGETERQLRDWMIQVQAATAKKMAESPEFATQFFGGFLKCPRDSVLEKLRELHQAKEDLISTAQRRLVYTKLAEFLSEREKFSALISAKPIKYQDLWKCEKTLVELSNLEIGTLSRVRREMESIEKTTTAFMDSMIDLPDSNELAAFVQFMCASWRTKEQQDIIKKRLLSTETGLLVDIIHKIFNGSSEAGDWAREAAEAAISNKIATWQRDIVKHGVKVLSVMEKVQYDEWFSDAHQRAWEEMDRNFRTGPASMAKDPIGFIQALNNNWLLQNQFKGAIQFTVLTLLKAIIDTTSDVAEKSSSKTWKKLNQSVTDFGNIYCTLKRWSLNRRVISGEFLVDLQCRFQPWKVLVFALPNDTKKLESLKATIRKFDEDINDIPDGGQGQVVLEMIRKDLRALSEATQQLANKI